MGKVDPAPMGEDMPVATSEECRRNFDHMRPPQRNVAEASPDSCGQLLGGLKEAELLRVSADPRGTALPVPRLTVQVHDREDPHLPAMFHVEHGIREPADERASNGRLPDSIHFGIQTRSFGDLPLRGPHARVKAHTETGPMLLVPADRAQQVFTRFVVVTDAHQPRRVSSASISEWTSSAE